jgi:hypothetical protein
MFAQREPGILADGRIHPDVTAQIAATRGRGSPLPPAVRDEMATAFGHDFGDVRVHSDALAGSLAQAVQARAFTTGADIYFAGSEYRPASAAGRSLLAHELTHVVQQRGMPTSGDLVVSDPADPQEREAERIAGSL